MIKSILIGLLILSNIGLWLSTSDHYRFDQYQREEIDSLQRNQGMMASCMRYPKYTDNGFCPNPDRVPPPW